MEFEEGYTQESDIIWPPGFTCIGRKTGSLAHGQTWILKDESDRLLEMLEEKKAKLDTAIQFATQKINALEIQLARQKDLLPDATEEDFFGMNSDEDLEEDFDEELEDDQGRIPQRQQKSSRGERENRDSHAENDSSFDPHDDSNPLVTLEKNSRIKVQLEDARDKVVSEMDLIRSSNIRQWYCKTSIENVARLDAPWVHFHQPSETETPENVQGDRQIEAANGEETEQTSQHSSKVQPCQAGTASRLFCAKLLGVESVKRSDGRTFHGTPENVTSREALRPLLRDGEELMKCQWHVIAKEAENDFEKACLLPLFAILPVEHSRHKCFFEAAFLSPYCKHGSLVDIVTKVSGGRRSYRFKEELILNNLKTTIKTMAFLERQGIYHGSIKPTNIYISSDGNHLLLGDFLPQAEMKRWFGNLRRRVANPPTYFSPELYKALLVDKVDSVQDIYKMYNLHKHDVFCLGLAYYYITRGKLPKGLFHDPVEVKKALRHLQQEHHDPELIQYLSNMLIFDENKRSTFWEFLNFSEKVTWVEGTFFDGVKQFMGWS